ncbi:hypothetical protein GUITHDRAFT_106459 [Guillardia theta CCMP2712]|uniref:Cap-specific mRNA (nucleoside-2'-O-)-methyltransferase 2 n=1 Tax=Guillardia theta (strain CCMP2712) TaxID=905079 RepID=L1JHC2_GUITC|nr:hypothetical protein GUITHDRAFT_106459 [Guillardia theta CCMP2712]EKX47913.1 hypothetical protein GUITHDRAFT_106459 [Guillardia theta CCMP2712]|eukprot:XP_005834893.1 hypothetical protein GUITHDRAFT_106459 [Guillardia theta CCMP2712]
MVSDGQKSDGQTVKPEDALRNKYAQLAKLKAKKLAAQQKSGAAGAAGAGSALASPSSSAGGGSSSSASFTSPSSSLKEKSYDALDSKKRKLESEPETVKASSLTREVIQAVQSSTKKAAVSDAAINPEVMNMNIPRRATPISSKPADREGNAPGSDPAGGSVWNKPRVSVCGDAGRKSTLSLTVGVSKAAGGNSGVTKGIPHEYQGKLQTLVEQQMLTADDVEGIKQCIRSEQEDNVARALDQFLKSNLDGIKNKVGYFNSILRKAKDGSSNEDEKPGSSKLIWPQEERIFSDMNLNEGRLIEKEIRLDNISCSLPPPESLFCEEGSTDSEMAGVKSNLTSVLDKLKAAQRPEAEASGGSHGRHGKLTAFPSCSSAKPELCSIYWAQYFEIFNSYSVIPNNCQTENKIKSLHLFESPLVGRGFAASISALNHFLKLKCTSWSLEWTGHTGLEWEMRCKIGTSENVRSEDERFLRSTLDHWVFNSEGQDFTINQSTIDALWKKTQAGLELTIAALSSLMQGGTLIMRMWQLYESENAALIFLLNSIFSETVVCRPSTVQSPCGHVFLVCLGFKGISQLHLDALSKAIGEDTEADEGPRMTMIPRSFLPSSWVQQIRTCVEFFANLQIAIINRDLDVNNNLQQHLREIYSAASNGSPYEDASRTTSRLSRLEQVHKVWRSKEERV